MNRQCKARYPSWTGACRLEFLRLGSFSSHTTRIQHRSHDLRNPPSVVKLQRLFLAILGLAPSVDMTKNPASVNVDAKPKIAAAPGFCPRPPSPLEQTSVPGRQFQESGDTLPNSPAGAYIAEPVSTRHCHGKTLLGGRDPEFVRPDVPLDDSECRRKTSDTTQPFWNSSSDPPNTAKFGWSDKQAKRPFLPETGHEHRSSESPPRGISPGDDAPDPDSEPGLLLQPETRPISHEQLVVEVKGIYAGLVMVEAKCIDIDERQSAAAQEKDPAKKTELKNDQWQSLIALHKQV